MGRLSRVEHARPSISSSSLRVPLQERDFAFVTARFEDSTTVHESARTIFGSPFAIGNARRRWNAPSWEALCISSPRERHGKKAAIRRRRFEADARASCRSRLLAAGLQSAARSSNQEWAADERATKVAKRQLTAAHGLKGDRCSSTVEPAARRRRNEQVHSQDSTVSKRCVQSKIKSQCLFSPNTNILESCNYRPLRLVWRLSRLLEAILASMCGCDKQSKPGRDESWAGKRPKLTTRFQSAAAVATICTECRESVCGCLVVSAALESSFGGPGQTLKESVWVTAARFSLQARRIRR